MFLCFQYGPIATVFRTALMIDRKYAGTTGYIDGFFLMIGKMHDACDPDTTANHVMTIVGKCFCTRKKIGDKSKFFLLL